MARTVRAARHALGCLALFGACSGVGAANQDDAPAAPSHSEPTEDLGEMAVAATAQAVALPATEPAPSRVPEIEASAWGEPSGGAATLIDQRFPLHGIAFQVQAQVHRRPEPSELPIGYLRRGAVFRAARVEGGRGCRKGWYELASGGYVCRGDGVAIGAEPQRFEPSPEPPDRFAGLPYRYAKNLAHDAHQYWRVPTEAERAAVAERLTELDAAAAAEAEAEADSSAKAEATTPASPEIEEGTVGLQDQADEEDEASKLPEILRMRMEPGFYVSIDRGYQAVEEEGAEGYLRTVRGAYLRDVALRDATDPTAPGRSLRDGTSLPLGFVFMKGVESYRRDPISGARTPAGTLERLRSFELDTKTADIEGKPYRVTREGLLIREHLVRVAERRARPSQVRRGVRWIHVRLSSQTLVAYEGDEPVFATIVSSGKEGHETPTGLFRVHTKHVSTTMDGLAGTDDAYSIEDVPWTIYFNGSYALHGAFWHDRFGIVRSHGCVNLAPPDARWLFLWTTPVVPAGWHGAVAPADDLGTYVLIED